MTSLFCCFCWGLESFNTYLCLLKWFFLLLYIFFFFFLFVVLRRILLLYGFFYFIYCRGILCFRRFSLFVVFAKNASFMYICLMDGFCCFLQKIVFIYFLFWIIFRKDVSWMLHFGGRLFLKCLRFLFFCIFL